MKINCKNKKNSSLKKFICVQIYAEIVHFFHFHNDFLYNTKKKCCMYPKPEKLHSHAKSYLLPQPGHILSLANVRTINYVMFYMLIETR